ncbi:hypothetical protein GOBAR_DD10728 [Gossypium barbadense]|nr:hypothetical protein GOBAR_DD10728 [Gossypium barbadense]
MAQPSLQEIPRENSMEPCFRQGDRNRTIYEERMVQLDELDEWRTCVKEKPRKLNEEPKRRHEEYMNETNQLKAGDKVLLDETDPQISSLEFETNGSNPLTVLNVFLTHSDFSTFKVNSTRLKPYLGRIIDNEKEELRLCKPP